MPHIKAFAYGCIPWPGSEGASFEQPLFPTRMVPGCNRSEWRSQEKQIGLNGPNCVKSFVPLFKSSKRGEEGLGERATTLKRPSPARTTIQQFSSCGARVCAEHHPQPSEIHKPLVDPTCCGWSFGHSRAPIA